MPKINAKGLNVFLDHRHVIKDLHLKIVPNKITAIMGPNGSGKSTLLKALSGLLKPTSGEVLLDNTPIHCFNRKKLARKLSFLMQHPEAPDNITVKELVSFGRFSHQRWFGLSKKDVEQVHWAIEQVHLEDKIHQSLNKLSGGQQKRAWIAMSLAQDSDVLLLDEPITSLDIRYQLETLDILQQLNLKYSKTIVVVLHDLQQVVQFADELVILEEGNLVCHTPIDSALDVGLFENVFGVKVRMLQDENNQQWVTVHGLTKSKDAALL